MPSTVNYAIAQTVSDLPEGQGGYKDPDAGGGAVFATDFILDGRSYAGVRFNTSDRFLAFSASLTFSYAVTQGNLSGQLTQVWLVDSPTAPAFDATTNRPRTLRATAGATILLASLRLDGSETSIALNTSVLSKVINQTNWAGNINLIIESHGTALIGFTASVFMLSTSQNTVLNDEDFSVAGRMHGTRWYLDPRGGTPVPINRVVRDGERYGLFVEKRFSDKVGRRDTRAHGRRDREARIWPRV